MMKLDDDRKNIVHEKYFKPLNDIAKMIDVIYKSNLVGSLSIKRDLVNFINEDLVPRVLIKHMGEIEHKREEDLHGFLRNEAFIKKIILKHEKQCRNRANIQKGIEKIMDAKHEDFNILTEEDLNQSIEGSNSARTNKVKYALKLQKSLRKNSERKKSPRHISLNNTNKEKEDNALIQNVWNKNQNTILGRNPIKLNRDLANIEDTRKITDRFYSRNRSVKLPNNELDL